MLISIICEIIYRYGSFDGYGIKRIPLSKLSNRLFSNVQFQRERKQRKSKGSPWEFLEAYYGDSLLFIADSDEVWVYNKTDITTEKSVFDRLSSMAVSCSTYPSAEPMSPAWLDYLTVQTKVGQIITGSVVYIGNKDIYVNLGQKKRWRY